jgi:hypothetical protein
MGGEADGVLRGTSNPRLAAHPTATPPIRKAFYLSYPPSDVFKPGYQDLTYNGRIYEVIYIKDVQLFMC